MQMSKKQKIDVSLIDLDKMKEKTTDMPGLLPYAHQSGSAIIKPEDKGKITGRAVAAMHSQTDMQMAQIYQQMQLLAEQAKSFCQRGLAHLMTPDSQTYPQLLWIKVKALAHRADPEPPQPGH